MVKLNYKTLYLILTVTWAIDKFKIEINTIDQFSAQPKSLSKLRKKIILIFGKPSALKNKTCFRNPL